MLRVLLKVTEVVTSDYFSYNRKLHKGDSFSNVSNYSHFPWMDLTIRLLAQRGT